MCQHPGMKDVPAAIAVEDAGERWARFDGVRLLPENSARDPGVGAALFKGSE